LTPLEGEGDNRRVAKKLRPDVLKAIRELGRQGGLIGGKARAKKLTAEERRDIARKAAQARWSKPKTS
jgi:hypothetical protein